ncbi:hypothetical protein A4X13_0g6728 [Tilletia indica]|uniref:Uncharacterized protein n=1 Tax=Tilletia indica TaxID=43049 RepID=A0A177T983_9BASI|nr:hypothetical protein A4X13_0g6728 [Tilletia indica]
MCPSFIGPHQGGKRSRQTNRQGHHDGNRTIADVFIFYLALDRPFHQKLTSLRAEADAHHERAEVAEGKVKHLEQENLTKDQEIASLQHKLSMLESDLERAEGKLTDAKRGAEAEESSRSTHDNLQRKIALLESELDTAEKNLRDATEKLRQVDVKAEHFERQVAVAEKERDAWEKKYEEAETKYRASKAELDEVVSQMESL